MQKIQLDKKELVFLGACILASQYESTPFELSVSRSKMIYELTENSFDNNSEN